MKKCINDLKSFVTVWLMLLLGIIIVANLFGKSLEQEILLLFTNTITGVITYYFNRKPSNEVEENKLNEVQK